MAAEAAAAALGHAHAATETFVFEHLGQSWLVLPLIALAAALAWWSWRRYGPAPSGWAGVAARLCRATALVLALVIAAGPAWRRTSVTDLPYRMLVAVDCSDSMSRTDGPGGKPRISQACALAHALEGLRTTNPLLAIDYRAIGGVSGSIPVTSLLDGTLTPSGTSSPLADDLDRLVTDARPDLLVVVTDGRVTSGSSMATIAERWHARDLQVMGLACGTDAVVPEIFIDEVVANHEAAKDEIEPILVRMSARGLPPGPITVTLTIDGEQPQTKTVEVPPSSDTAQLAQLEATFDATFHAEGSTAVHVAATSGAIKAPAQELSVQVRERRLTVLMLGQRPFYELRYMREAFKRDKTVTLHAYLADGRWRRWGTAGPDDLPLSPEELAGYDAIVIGDLSRDALRDADLVHIEKAVRNGGSGLLWLLSDTGAIASFTSTRLGELIPVNLPDAQTVSGGFLAGEPRRLARTEIAMKLGLLDPASDGGLDWGQLPPLLGAAPLSMSEVKPGADVLATDQSGNPLVVTKAYPAGRSVLIGVDDTWRWRRNVGDQYLHRFQSQLLRFAAAGRAGGGRSWQLFASPRRAVPGEPVVINLSPIGTPDTPPDTVTVQLSAADGAQQILRMERDAKGYTAHLSAPVPGTWTLSVAGGVDPRKVDPGELKVLQPEDEMRDPRLDRPGLDAFAAATAGTIYTAVPPLVAALPKDLRRSESVTVHAGLWDTWWALLVLTAVLGLEWALRRVARLP